MIGNRGNTSNYAAIIVAGGAGRRLGGVDKAALIVGGRRLLDYAFDAAATVEADPIVLVGSAYRSRKDRDDALPVVTCREDPPGSGPLAALCAGAKKLTEIVIDESFTRPEWTTLLGCDTPAASQAISLLHQSIQALPPSSDGYIAADSAGRPQWLLGIYRTAALIRACHSVGVPTNQPLRAALSKMTLTTTPVADHLIHDIDTWSDYRWWQERVHHRPT